ncbi:MAG TPA: ATP-binding protein [Candidatus Polarisedimenticolaceae bacterium]
MNDEGHPPGGGGLLHAYIAALAVLAAASTWATWSSGGVDDPLATALVAALAALAGSRPVSIPAFRSSFTATHPFVFLALAGLGPLEAVLTAVAGVAGLLLGRKRPTIGHRFLFNVASVMLTATMASWAYGVAGGEPGGALLAEFWPLTAAAVVYFLANTGLLSIAISLERGSSFFDVWREGFLWSAASYFAGLSLATVLLALFEAFGAWSLALGIPPCWLLVAFYETHRERIAERERRIDEVERLNADLEKKVAERTSELVETNRKLVEASKAKSEFLANVSHELRTPLNAVIGFSEYLAGPDFDNLTARQKGFLADIRDSGEHLLQLINDILDLSKIEAGKLEVQRDFVSFAEVLREAAAILRVQAERKSLRFEVHAASDVGVVHVDPKLARQILVNLLSNAVKFTPEGGRIEARAFREGDDLVVEVEDTGIGIPAEHLARIFEEFHQVDGSYARKYQGTGLGLALVRTMVGMHGGSVGVRSAPGEGSTFVCRFPSCAGAGNVPDLPERDRASAPAPVAPDEAPRAARARVPRVLVVEDNEVSRKLARNVLRSRGFEVLEAETGEEALEVVALELPDLILMDLQLPGLDGLEVTRRLKGDARTAGVRIVALTAHAAGIDEGRARAAGCEGYLTKPIRLSTFPSQVAAYLEGVA